MHGNSSSLNAGYRWETWPFLSLTLASYKGWDHIWYAASWKLSYIAGHQLSKVARLNAWNTTLTMLENIMLLLLILDDISWWIDCYTPSKFNSLPLNYWLVWRQSFPIAGPLTFLGRTVKLREGNHQQANKTRPRDLEPAQGLPRNGILSSRPYKYYLKSLYWSPRGFLPDFFSVNRWWFLLGRCGLRNNHIAHDELHEGVLNETSLIDPELICWGSELHFNDAKNWELMNALWWQRVKWNDQDLYHHNTNNCIWYTPLKNIYHDLNMPCKRKPSCILGSPTLCPHQFSPEPTCLRLL